MAAQIRKLIVQVDETRLEMGQTINPPTRRVFDRVRRVFIFTGKVAILITLSSA